MKKTIFTMALITLLAVITVPSATARPMGPPPPPHHGGMMPPPPPHGRMQPRPHYYYSTSRHPRHVMHSGVYLRYDNCGGCYPCYSYPPPPPPAPLHGGFGFGINVSL